MDMGGMIKFNASEIINPVMWLICYQSREYLIGIVDTQDIIDLFTFWGLHNHFVIH